MKVAGFPSFWWRIFSVYVISLLCGFREVIATGAPANELQINSDSSASHHQTSENADQSADITIWRDEDSKAYLIPKEDYGIFYTEDSYFMYEEGDDTKPPEGDDKPLRKTFAWVGKNCSEQKVFTIGLALTKLASDVRNTFATPTNEVEGMETEAFKSYFSKYEVRSKKLPVSKPLTKAQAEATLYQVKVKKIPYITEVRAEVQSLNAGDSFVLDLGSFSDNVFIYYGAESNFKEKTMSWRLGFELLNHEHKGKGERVEIKNLDNMNADQAAYAKLFFEGLGHAFPISPGRIAPADAVEIDEKFEEERKEALELQEIIFDATEGTMRAKKIEKKPPKKVQLKSESCVLLDSKSLAGVFVWKGENCSEEKLTEANRIGEELLKQSYPWLGKVKIEKENEESTAFKANFVNWIGGLDIPPISLDTRGGLQAPRKEKPVPLPLVGVDKSASLRSGEVGTPAPIRSDEDKSAH